MGEAIRKVLDVIRRAVYNHRMNGIRNILNHILYPMMPSSTDQLKLLPELEIKISDKWTVKHKLDLRTHTRAHLNKRRPNFKHGEIIRQLEKLLELIKLKEDPNFKNHFLRCRFESVIGSMTR